MVSELGWVCLKNTVLQVARSEMNPNVEQVQKVGDIIQTKPKY